MAVAFGFLTRLPVSDVEWREGELGRALAWFPLVGVVVAGIGTGVRWGVGEILPPLVAVVAGVLAMVVVTGAFHEDGLADTADGLWGGFTPQRRLEIMRDSRIGTYGTVALVGALGLRIGLLVGLPVEEFLVATVIGHALGRWSILPMSSLLDPVGGSSAEHLVERPGAIGWMIATTVALAVLLPLGWLGWVPAAVAVVAAAGCAVLVQRKLGGITGDALGATNQVVHIASMGAVVAVLR